ncbi:MAG: hypothetical protein ABIP89_20990, partial [Polyangiaceae bacterium]
MRTSSTSVIALVLATLGFGAACSADKPAEDRTGSSVQALAGTVLEAAGARASVEALRSRCAVGAAASDAGAPLSPAPAMLRPSPVDHFAVEGAALTATLPAPHISPHPTKVSLPVSADGTFHLVDIDTEMQLQVSLVGAKRVGVQVGAGYAIYPGAEASGADLLQLVTHEGAESFFSFARAPATSALAFDVQLDDHVAGLRSLANTIEFLDAGGVPRLRIAPPYLQDATCKRKDATLSLEGCAYDSNAGDPSVRPVTPPGSRTCRVRVTWRNQDVAYPAIVDPLWSSTGAMAVRRQYAGTVRLAEGRVLTVGGLTGGTADTAVPYTELYLPETQVWVTAGNMLGGPRYLPGVAMLPDGRALVAGGFDNANFASPSTDIYTVDDTINGFGPQWASASNTLHASRGALALVTLDTGNVLAVGGSSASVLYNNSEEFVTATSSWNPPVSFAAGQPGRSYMTANLVTASGVHKVFAAGGYLSTGVGSAHVDIYDTATHTWTAGAHLLPTPRFWHTATTLRYQPDPAKNGKVLVVGGYNNSYVHCTSDAELYDPNTGTFAPAGSSAAVEGHGAAELYNGDVMMVGGSTSLYGWDVTNEINIWHPALNSWTPQLPLANPRAWGNFSMADGSLVYAGGWNGAACQMESVVFEPDNYPVPISGIPYAYYQDDGTANTTSIAAEGGEIVVSFNDTRAHEIAYGSSIHNSGAAFSRHYSASEFPHMLEQPDEFWANSPSVAFTNRTVGNDKQFALVAVTAKPASSIQDIGIVISNDGGRHFSIGAHLVSSGFWSGDCTQPVITVSDVQDAFGNYPIFVSYTYGAKIGVTAGVSIIRKMHVTAAGGVIFDPIST